VEKNLIWLSSEIPEIKDALDRYPLEPQERNLTKKQESPNDFTKVLPWSRNNPSTRLVRYPGTSRYALLGNWNQKQGVPHQIRRDIWHFEIYILRWPKRMGINKQNQFLKNSFGLTNLLTSCSKPWSLLSLILQNPFPFIAGNPPHLKKNRLELGLGSGALVPMVSLLAKKKITFSSINEIYLKKSLLYLAFIALAHDFSSFAQPKNVWEKNLTKRRGCSCPFTYLTSDELMGQRPDSFRKSPLVTFYWRTSWRIWCLRANTERRRLFPKYTLLWCRHLPTKGPGNPKGDSFMFRVKKYARDSTEMLFRGKYELVRGGYGLAGLI